MWLSPILRTFVQERSLGWSRRSGSSILSARLMAATTVLPPIALSQFKPATSLARAPRWLLRLERARALTWPPCSPRQVSATSGSGAIWRARKGSSWRAATHDAPLCNATARMQKKMLGLSVESDYVDRRDDLRFNWRYTDGLEHGSARQWRERDGYRHR